MCWTVIRNQPPLLQHHLPALRLLVAQTPTIKPCQDTIAPAGGLEESVVIATTRIKIKMEPNEQPGVQAEDDEQAEVKSNNNKLVKVNPEDIDWDTLPTRF